MLFLIEYRIVFNSISCKNDYTSPCKIALLERQLLIRILHINHHEVNERKFFC